MTTLAHLMSLPCLCQRESGSDGWLDMTLIDQSSDGDQGAVCGSYRIFPGLNTVLLGKIRRWLLQQRDQGTAWSDYLQGAQQNVASDGIQDQIYIVHHLLKGG
jgi:hypothetical protein